MTIVLDPLHGGLDWGATGTMQKYGIFRKVNQKNLNLDVAIAIRDHLKYFTDMTVLLTRDDDKTLSTEQRNIWLSGRKVDAYIAIDYGVGYYKGLEIYYSHTRIQDAGFAAALHHKISQQLGCEKKSVFPSTRLSVDDQQCFKGKGDYIQVLARIECIENPFAMDKLGNQYYENLLKIAAGVTEAIESYFKS